MRAPTLAKLGAHLVLGASAVLGLGCSQAARPPTPVPARARERLVVHKQFRIASFDFGRNVDEHFNPLTEALPAMLLTELRKTGRFEIYEGGNLRVHVSGGETLTESNAWRYVDGYVSGTITSEDAARVCFDVRLANSVNHEVLYAAAACADLMREAPTPSAAPATAATPAAAGSEPAPPVQSPPVQPPPVQPPPVLGPKAPRGVVPAMIPDRKALERVAQELTRAIKNVGNGKVTAADGQLVFVDKGVEADVMPGMVAYVVATGDAVKDPSVHKTVAAVTGVDPARLAGAITPVIIGEMYIVSVEKGHSVGRLFRGDYVLPGDTVFFK
jgi:hypothetical protein